MQTGQSKSRILKFPEMLAKVFCFELYTPVKIDVTRKSKDVYFMKGYPVKIKNTLIGLACVLTALFSKAEINSANQCDGVRVIMRISDLIPGGSV
jgi:hypothetical protein